MSGEIHVFQEVYKKLRNLHHWFDVENFVIFAAFLENMNFINEKKYIGNYLMNKNILDWFTHKKVL